MRLIDAEALKRNLCETCNQEACDGMLDSISECYSVRIIDEQPTAYDVDKVVKELRKATNHIANYGVRYIGERKAIEIAKRGGVE